MTTMINAIQRQAIYLDRSLIHSTSPLYDCVTYNKINTLTSLISHAYFSFSWLCLFNIVVLLNSQLLPFFSYTVKPVYNEH